MKYKPLVSCDFCDLFFTAKYMYIYEEYTKFITFCVSVKIMVISVFSNCQTPTVLAENKI